MSIRLLCDCAECGKEYIADCITKEVVEFKGNYSDYRYDSSDDLPEDEAKLFDKIKYVCICGEENELEAYSKNQWGVN